MAASQCCHSLADTALPFPESPPTLLSSASSMLVSIVLREQKQKHPALPTGSSWPMLNKSLLYASNCRAEGKNKMVKLPVPVLKIEYLGLGT